MSRDGVTPARRRRAVALAVLAAAVFSLTFVLNRKMADGGGHWAWTSALRFLMMLPMLAAVIVGRGRTGELRRAWKASPGGWFLWGSVGSAVFYTTLAAAGAIAPAWVVAGTWPVAIVIGVLLSPLLYKDQRRHIPRLALIYSAIVLAGVGLLQAGQMGNLPGKSVLTGLLLVLVSATAHPLGNRASMLLMEKAAVRPDPYVRLVALILGALPCWLALCVLGYLSAGWPPASQLISSAMVAACGFIATPLFYAAAESVGRDASALAAVEATQAAEMIFTLIFEAILLGITPPGAAGTAGMALISAGILLHARASGAEPDPGTKPSESGTTA